ncbi:MAG: zinc-ribbon domain-containing protein [Acidobacteriia bacterium]|nr:zinc-ribbon domain-containing protein [Terriglobia bacterium]
MAVCAKCGAPLAEGAGFCGSCGASVSVAAAGAPAGPAAGPTATTASSGGLAPNIAGALAYITIIPAIIFLVVEPYNKDRFIKFHAFQSLFFNVAWIVLVIAMMIVGLILALIPVVGWILDVLLWLAIGLGGFCLWLYTMYQAYNEKKFMLPVIGKIADQQASR